MPSQSKTGAVHEALRDGERHFQLLVQAVKDYAIFMLDPQGRITTWNSGAERIKGYRAEEIIGDHFSRFYTEEDQREGVPMRSLLRAATEGRHEAEGWRIRKDGSRFRASVVIDPIHDDAGNLIGFAKVTRDVTERRLAQEMLDQARERRVSVAELLKLLDLDDLAGANRIEALTQIKRIMTSIGWRPKVTK